jgi:hypothetical protein
MPAIGAMFVSMQVCNRVFGSMVVGNKIGWYMVHFRCYYIHSDFFFIVIVISYLGYIYTFGCSFSANVTLSFRSTRRGY